MLVGYTPGGSPIFHNASSNKPRKKTRGDKNIRIACTQCTGRTTKNQAKNTGGKCLYCKAPLKGSIGDRSKT